MPKSFKKKPFTIQAIEWDGTNIEEIKEFAGDAFTGMKDTVLTLSTLEGFMTCHIGDWVVCGIEGEVYSVKGQIFNRSYEEAL